MTARDKRKKKVETVSSKHPMVGRWEQGPSSHKRTTIVYSISVKQGKFVVTGKDSADGTAMKISRVKWDGYSLGFMSFYPRNQHTATVEFEVRPKHKLRCKVSGIYYGGEPFSVVQVWTKKRSN